MVIMVQGGYLQQKAVYMRALPTGVFSPDQHGLMVQGSYLQQKAMCVRALPTGVCWCD